MQLINIIIYSSVSQANIPRPLERARTEIRRIVAQFPDIVSNHSVQNVSIFKVKSMHPLSCLSETVAGFRNLLELSDAQECVVVVHKVRLMYELLRVD